MPRNKEEVHRRLQQAALELYRMRGYDQTTTAEIAARAGVTERTFFRHFPDKREVLFDGEATLKTILTSAIADAPPELGPWDTLFRAFHAVEPLLIENRPFSEPRQQVIAGSPALQERETAKLGALTLALAAALHSRGVENRLATLAAQVGMAALSYATIAWLEDASRDLGDSIAHAFHEVRALSSASPEAAR